MSLLNKYLFNIFSAVFFPIFLTLYIVTSIIFLVKIATLTSIIQINFLELLQLYSYSIPHILFYTLPISYFIALSLSIAKLSKDDELIVIISFGLNPTQLIKIFLPITIMISILLLIISLGLRPKADYLRSAFLNIKKQESQFNIKASEYGQQVGSWLIYVDKEKKQKFQDITLLQFDKNKDNFISAKYAFMENKSNFLNLHLIDGKSFVISDNIQQVDFKQMILQHTIAEIKNIKSFNDIVMYWSNRKTNFKKSKDFSFRILISLFPLLSLYFILTFGFFNPRYDANKTAISSTIVTIIFVVLASKMSSKYPNDVLYALPLGYFLISYLSYFFTIKRSY
jgi:lipopolysaccharide export system permease protein